MLLRTGSDVAHHAVDLGHLRHDALERLAGLGQVNSAINQMDHVTKQNAAMMEETTAAGHSLAQEAGNLASLIGQFQVGTTVVPARRRGPPSRSRQRIRQARGPCGHQRSMGSGQRAAAATARKPAPEAAADSWQDF